MLNLARQGFANPFFPSTGISFQPGPAVCAGWPSAALGVGQQIAGFVPSLYGAQPTPSFGFGIPIPAQVASGALPNIHPLAAHFMSNWMLSQLTQPGSGRIGPYGIDPRLGQVVGSQVGVVDPNFAPFGVAPTAAGDPTGLPLPYQLNPLVNPIVQQQLPIRPLIGGQHAFGSQQLIPGFASPVSQLMDPYRAFIEAQLISNLLTNQVTQRGTIPELSGFGAPFTGQPVNPIFNVPFYL